jgi:phage gpG-like protein
MQAFEVFFKNILNDIKVELSEEFDKNFERKAFFDQQWADTKWAVNKGSLMLRTGAGRRSIMATIEGGQIVWRSSLPYMGIHNDGGEIEVTAKMKKFFWAMFYKASNAVTFKVKTREASANKRNEKLTAEAAIWKSLALMKVGEKIKIPKRQFIGDHPVVDASIKKIVDANAKELHSSLLNVFKPDNFKHD